MNAPSLELRRCSVCHLRFVPTDGPCPRCGAIEVEPYPVPGVGRVVAATELSAPAPGWPVPHRLVLLEVADGVRVLAVAPGPLPAIGATVPVQLAGAVYAVGDPAVPADERGEGDSPKTRRLGPSFEPPR